MDIDFDTLRRLGIGDEALRRLAMGLELDSEGFWEAPTGIEENDE